MIHNLKKLSYLRVIYISMALLGIFHDANAETSVGRYLTISTQPFPAQNSLLQQQFQGHFPFVIKTVGDAMQYLLRASGYQLMTYQQQSTDAEIMLQKPLPAVDRRFGPMALSDGLNVLAGEPFQLLIDPVHRLVSFRLKPIYASRYTLNH